MEDPVKLSALAARVITGGAVACAAVVAVPSASWAQSQVSAQDRAFLVAAHQSNLAEIAAGNAAQRQATSDTVREHGQRFITDHSRLDDSLRQVAQQLGVKLPSSPSAAQRQQLAAVTAEQGAAFDQAWVRHEIRAHQQSLAAGTTELQEGSNEDVKTLARNAAPVIKAHLAMIESSGRGISVEAGTGGAGEGPGALPWVLLAAGAAITAASVAVLRRRA